jgi:acetyltransferase-like isoleucine patch superfamily enzyme
MDIPTSRSLMRGYLMAKHSEPRTDVTPRGRDLYQRLRPALSGLERLARIIPLPTAQSLLSASRHGAGLLSRAWRFSLLRRLASQCGELVDIREGVYLYGVDRLTLGDRISIHPMCYLDATGGLSIGSDTSIAHAVTIMTTSHAIDAEDPPIRDQGVELRPVTIGEGVWIGAGARILGGVAIGDGAVVGAGSVVTRDVPPRSIAVGVPARVVRRRS